MTMAPPRLRPPQHMPAANPAKRHLLNEDDDTADAAVGIDYKSLYEHRAIVPHSVRQLPHYEFSARFIGAGLSNIFSSMVTNPIDMTSKWYYGVIQYQAARSGHFVGIAKNILSTEGPLALMSGVRASMLREGIYATIRLGTYEAHKDALHSLSNGYLTREGIPLKALSGLLSGAVGAAIANPTDLIKVRMQAPHTVPKPEYSKIPSALKAVYAEGGGSLAGGLRALWRGTTATVTRGAVITTAQIGSYDHFKQVVKSRGVMKEGVPLHLTSSLFAGLVCSIASNPVDVVKVRLMNDRARIRHVLDTSGISYYNHSATTQIHIMDSHGQQHKPAILPNEFYEPYLSELAKSRRPNPIRGLYPLEDRPGMISMLAGKPNADTFPFTSFSFTARDPTYPRVASNEPPESISSGPTRETNAPGQLHITIPPAQLAAALQYGPTSGLPDLISWVYTLQAAQHGRHKGEGWRVTVGTGSQDLLYKSFSAFVNPGDAVFIEAPAYAGVLPMLKSSRCELVEVPTDGKGIQSFKLRNILDTWPEGKPKPKVLYTTPYGSNPSGATATVERRKEVLELSRKHGFLILEDDPYFYLYFGERPRPPSYFHLEAQDGGPVNTINSSWLQTTQFRYPAVTLLTLVYFSPLGLRIGFVSGPSYILDKIDLHTAAANLQTSSFTQVLTYTLLAEWGLPKFDAHIDNVSVFYKEKRDVFEAAMNRHLSGLAEWDTPQAGMFFWFKLNLPSVKEGEAGDSEQLVREKAVENGVLALPGTSFYPNGEKSAFVRAAFSLLPAEQVDEGLRRLAEVIRG
ncbi:mitochondrial carrier protein [Ceratobasidium sp. AG-Ba]|nr:mitochondrial carrier protein [Ceratobasidium sp. AG-Ba]